VAEVISSTLSGERTGGGRGEVVNRTLAERLASAQGQVEERRLITALFADVSGFTALAHGLDAEQLVDIIGPIVSRLADIVTRYGGYVGKFAGDAILAFFGAPVSHEDDAVRALLAARDMQRESAELFASLGPEAAHLTLHVGVNTGYVVAGFFGDQVRMEYSVLGDAVNVAQRLESAAPGGAVYVGRDTYLLARTRFVFEDLGGIQVKGKPEPVPAWRLVDEASAAEASRAVGAAGGRVVGRARELAALTAVLAPVAGGGGAAALVGEPGTGKSALFEEARWRGEEDGQEWAETHCVAYRSRPYRPYVELLRMLTEIPEDVEPQLAARRIAGEAARVGVTEAAPFFLRLLGLPLPAGVADTAPVDPLAFRQGLHRAVADYLVARAADRPLVLGIEDVHWGDPGTLDLTRHLVARSREAPFSLVLTARPEGREVAAGLVEGNERSTVLELGPLGAEAIAELAEDLLGSPVDPALATVIAERTSGNPLFAQQLLRSLQETEELERGPQGWRLPAGWSADSIPTAVEQVLAARIDLLPRPAADLLQVASVIGRTVLPDLLRHVAGDQPDHDAAVDQLLRGGFFDVVEEGGESRFWFHHALLVDVAYGRLLRARRRAIHRATVAGITALYGTGDDMIDMLARHASGGEMGREAVLYLERAGTRSEALFANEQAVAYLRQAIEICDRDAEAADRLPALLLRCAAVEEVRGAYREALELFERAATLLPGDLRPRLGQAATLRKLGEVARALAVVRAAREAHGDGNDEDEARLACEEGWVLALLGRYHEAGDVLHRGLESAERSGDRLLEAQVLFVLARNEQSTDEDEAAEVHACRARDLFEAEGNLVGLASALRVLGGIEQDRGHPAEMSRATLERALEIARRVGHAEEEGGALINLGAVFAAEGQIEEALRCDVEAAAAFERVGLKGGIACAYCNIGDHLHDLGRIEEALEASRTGLTIGEEIGNRFWISGGLNGVAEAMLSLGDAAGAAAQAERAFAVGVESGLTARAEAALDLAVTSFQAIGDAEGEARMLSKAAAAGVAPPDPTAEKRWRWRRPATPVPATADAGTSTAGA
jgi:class 3 adenylate cyclase/tetratricopeptide (TPR) repeat protein